MSDLDTLRDDLAMAALQGMLAAGETCTDTITRGSNMIDIIDVSGRVARKAYRLADAMLEARKVKPGTPK